MIEKIKIRGYRIFKDIEIRPKPGMNLIVGGNEAGKSTLLEAITLALTGRINGRSAVEELNPFWFNLDLVSAYLAKLNDGKCTPMPEILIELYFQNSAELQVYCGANNSDTPPTACPGIAVKIAPNPEYLAELEAWKTKAPTFLPVDYYMIEWRSFAGERIATRQRLLSTAVIDSRTIRSATGIDFHLRQILNDYMTPAERALVSYSFREVKAEISEKSLKMVNERIAKDESAIQDQKISLAMDQSARASWDAAVSPHIRDIPFSMVGQGAQASVKISLALNKQADHARFVTIEEPECHQSHTSLTQLISQIEHGAGNGQQLFITTHSAYVVNRLGLDRLVLLASGQRASMTGLDPKTIGYFQKLPGYDTLRLVLAHKLVLVEGPSDEIYFERVFRDQYGKLPMELGIDVLSMRGLSFWNCLALCHALDKEVVAVRDNDGKDLQALNDDLKDFIKPGRRTLFISNPANGRTLEPHLRGVNSEPVLRQILDIQARADLATWMANNKTEGALRIAASDQKITAPQYMIDAVKTIHG
ncbi:ATP-dependent nuclease [Paraherbaspirillum soli]|uniref:ATP-dependent endonuclease n=1 Tax=Paraherbaspirillum soli TaxID=631222 RepID=A0ABW0MF58_9BURK